MNDAVRVGQISLRPSDDGVCIVLEHLVSVVIVEHDGSSEVCSLIVGRSPGVVVTRGLVVGVKYLACRFPSRHFEELSSLGHICLASFLVVTVVGFCNCEITSTNRSRTVYAGVGALTASMLPLQEVVPVAVGSSKHSVEVRLGSGEVFLFSCKQIGSDASDTHPRNIVIILVVTADALLIPSLMVARDEVGVKVLEHSGILLVACCFESIEDDLEHFCISPPASSADNVTRACRLVGASLPLFHHIVSLILRKGLLNWVDGFNCPGNALFVEVGHLGSIDDGRNTPITNSFRSGKRKSSCRALKDIIFVGCAFHGNEIPRAFTVG